MFCVIRISFLPWVCGAGDAVMSNPVSWAVADLDIQLAEDVEASLGPYAPKPEIKHMFR